MHSEKEHILSVLGGPDFLGPTAAWDMDNFVRNRFPFKVGDRIKHALDISTNKLAETLNVSESTFNRVKKSKGLFSLDASDRLYRIARIYAFASDVFENEKEAAKWMNSSQTGLGGRTPIDLLKTDAGTKEVEELLGRIEYGVLS